MDLKEKGILELSFNIKLEFSKFQRQNEIYYSFTL